MIDGRVLAPGAPVGVKISPRFGLRLAMAAGVGMCGMAGVAVALGGRNRLVGMKRMPHKIPQTLVDALCGAAGEVTALVALYPLDTVKTLCQAKNVGSGVVVKELLALGPGKMLCAAYAGVGQAALGSLLLGALYLMTFYGVSRFGKRVLAATDSWSQGKSAIVASTAGAMASIVGSLIEAPVESLKIRAQAGWGSVQGSRNALIGGGWYEGMAFFPYLFKAVPNDVAELFTYSQLHDLTKRTWINGLGCEKVDAMVGAAAGAVATIVSMPFDVIFTRMNVLHLPDGRNKSIAALLGAFWTTAVSTCGHGTRACFVGLVPRLLQTVPAGMVYWMAVEATRRALDEQFDVEQ